MSNELLHRVWLVRVTFDNFSIIVREAQKAHQLMLILRLFQSQYCLNCVWIWSDYFIVHHPSEVLYRVLQDFAFRRFAFQSCPFHTCKHFVQSLDVILKGWCRYHPIVHITHYQGSIILCYSFSACDISLWNVAVALHWPNGNPLSLEQFQLASKSRILPILFSK